MMGVACAKAIEKITKLKTTLKWPNDVHIKGKKVCGILTEISSEPNKVRYIIVGLGINVNNEHSDFPKQLQAQVTTLLHELKKPVNRVDLFQELLMEFERLYIPFAVDPVKKIPEIIQSWREISDTIGRDVKIETISGSIAGLAVEISEDGSLLVETKSGEKKKIIAGDCIYLDQNYE
jgi:BirA family biotin operon repressor/biotin-[acetyl-CoA-carboxylase] ligase